MTQPELDPADDPDAELQRALDERLGRRQDDDAVLARIKARVMGWIEASGDPRNRTVRSEEGRWQRIGPGVERKLLWSNASVESWMMRLAPGAVVPAHLHTTDEECVVLAGTVRIGTELVLNEGDFHVAPQGSVHQAVTTDTGAVVYLRGAPTAASRG